MPSAMITFRHDYLTLLQGLLQGVAEDLQSVQAPSLFFFICLKYHLVLVEMRILTFISHITINNIKKH